MIYQKVGKSSIHLPLLSVDICQGDLENKSYGRLLSEAKERGLIHWDLTTSTVKKEMNALDRWQDFRKSLNPSHELFISAGISPIEKKFYRSSGKKGVKEQIDYLLKVMQRDYLDLFYISDTQGDTPSEESSEALAQEIRQGRILYAGLRDYNTSDTQALMDHLSDRGIPVLMHRRHYSFSNREVERTLDHLLEVTETGLSVTQPFKWDKRHESGLRTLAKQRSQTLEQLCLAWVFRQNYVNNVLIGLHSEEQLEECCLSLDNLSFDENESAIIEELLRV
ncbi:MAG: aldo/keto reductase [Spirochaetaceae bacterium]|nr:aldo/keto reductase [Spirochaetaceae bacterium]